MVLVSLLVILLLILSLSRFSVFEILEPLSRKAHLLCINKLPPQSTSLSELKALVCAQNFSNLNESQFYISSGLIHLFVVSGAHLIIIEKLLIKLSFNRTLIFIILVIYSFACGLNAPVTRCLIAYSLNLYLTHKKIYWPPHLRLLIIGSMTLSFNYNWINSLSLQMSWIAAFLVVLVTHFYKEYSVFFKQSLFFITLLPSVVFFQIPSPVVIIINMILTPILEFILFPLGLMVLMFNFLNPLFEFLIYIFKTLLQAFELDFQIQSISQPPQFTIYNWGLIFLMHGIFHLIYIHKKRSEFIS